MTFNSKKESTSDELIFNGISAFVSTRRSWTGTMTGLSSALRVSMNRETRTFMPRSSSALRVVINRVVNRLRNRGISVKFSRATDRNRTRLVKFSLKNS